VINIAVLLSLFCYFRYDVLAVYFADLES